MVIELDGAQHLADAEAYRRDRRKDRLLQENGYLVLRFLAEDVGKDLDQVLDAILRALGRRNSLALGELEYVVGMGRPRRRWCHRCRPQRLGQQFRPVTLNQLPEMTHLARVEIMTGRTQRLGSIAVERPSMQEDRRGLFACAGAVHDSQCCQLPCRAARARSAGGRHSRQRTEL